jgi:DNA modification methylase
MRDYHPDIVWKDINSVIPYVNNTKKHPSEQVDKIAGSIAEFGFDQPIVVDGEGVVIKGHGRLLASRKLNLSQVPVLVRTDLTPMQVKAARIADNRVAESEWDDEMLRIELGELKDMNFDLSLTGFEAKELDLCLKEEVNLTESEVTDTKEDELNDLVAKYGTSLGQIWQIGQQRLAIGDCTDTTLVDLLLDGNQPQILFTSPPYWIGLDYEQEQSWSEVQSLMANFAKVYAPRIAQDGRIIINTGMSPGKRLEKGQAHTKLLIDEWQRQFELNGWLLRYVRFWIKDGGIYHTNPDFDCIDNHSEFIGYFYHPKAKFRGVERLGEPWCGKGYWDDIPGAAKQSGHIAAFPVELVARNVRLFTRSGESVMEPFGGSGTTLITCEQLKRKGYSTELNVGYAALTLERFVNELNVEPKLL